MNLEFGKSPACIILSILLKEEESKGKYHHMAYFTKLFCHLSENSKVVIQSNNKLVIKKYLLRLIFDDARNKIKHKQNIPTVIRTHALNVLKYRKRIAFNKLAI